MDSQMQQQSCLSRSRYSSRTALSLRTVIGGLSLAALAAIAGCTATVAGPGGNGDDSVGPGQGPGSSGAGAATSGGASASGGGGGTATDPGNVSTTAMGIDLPGAPKYY